MNSNIHSLRTDALPPEIKGRSAWYGPELARSTDWIARLSKTEIAEVESAIRRLVESSFDLTSISSQDFPLPTLAARLCDVLDEVINGRGFALIRALPVQRWSKREAAIAFLGIGVHLGHLRMQNAAGHLLGHVKDLGRSSEDPNARIYQTKERQTFHTDSCDVVGLLCLQPAKFGGLSTVVSSTTIFNEMRRRRPDLLRVLLIRLKPIDVVKLPKAANLISGLQCLTGMGISCRRPISGNTSSLLADFPELARLALFRSKH